MDSSNLIIGVFDPLARTGVIGHYLTRPDFSLQINLPEHRSTGPKFGRTNEVFSGKAGDNI
jgi:hypothetical protein